MGKKGFFATLFLIILLIFLLFPISTGKEYFLIPERIVTLDDLTPDDVSTKLGTVSFSLNDYFGFFTEDLEISYIDKKKYKVAIGDSSFINYSKIPDILDIQNSLGEGQSIIETKGYPLIRGNRIVVLSDSFVSLYDLEGHLYWKKEILSLITSLSVSDKSVLIGYLDGICELINISGKKEFSFRPGGSRIEAIYSAAVSGDGQYIAIISGLDPQRFILLQYRKGEYKPVYHKELDQEFRRSIDMYFSQDDSMVFFENSQGVNIFDVNLKTLVQAGNGGSLKKIYKDNERDLFSLLLATGSGGILNILTSGNRTVLSKNFPSNELFFTKRDDRYYIGSDNVLMYLKLVNR
jgi:hypothetical protein